MIIVFYLAMAAVILGHFLFAYAQWYKWPALCNKLTDLDEQCIDNTIFLGRSFASYNASIGIGLIVSFRLAIMPQAWVQGATLALIVATAAVGALGTRGNTILIFRLLPAAAALLALVILQVMTQTIPATG